MSYIRVYSTNRDISRSMQKTPSRGKGSRLRCTCKASCETLILAFFGRPARAGEGQLRAGEPFTGSIKTIACEMSQRRRVRKEFFGHNLRSREDAGSISHLRSAELVQSELQRRIDAQRKWVFACQCIRSAVFRHDVNCLSPVFRFPARSHQDSRRLRFGARRIRLDADFCWSTPSPDATCGSQSGRQPFPL